MLMILLKETRDVIVKRAIVTALSNIVDCKYLPFFLNPFHCLFYILYLLSF